MVKIFVGNIHDPAPDFETQLRCAFEKFGTVTDCRLISNYAFVHMESEDSASKAISGLHKTMLGNSRVNVELGRPDRNRNERGQTGGDRRGGYRGGGGGGGMGGGGQMAYMSNFAFRGQPSGAAAFFQQTQPGYGLAGYGFQQQQQPLLAYGLPQRPPNPADMIGGTSMDSFVANGGDGGLIDASAGGRQKRFAADASGLGGLSGGGGGGGGGQAGGDGGKMPRLDYEQQQQQQQVAAYYPGYADLLTYGGQNYSSAAA
uniref:RRM domain-containing protein n=1 Tax=Macrostomum lignano TaxID=282301 RepID=A0A1I8HKS6_9PLAT